MDNKLNSHYKIKSQNLEVKDFDENSRKVSMYLSSFGNIDSDNDLIVRGAFKKSLQERGVESNSNRKIAFLRYHNWEMPIGKFLELKEDENGLFAVAQLGNSTLGNDALMDYKDGIIREHSIGFRYIADKIKWVDDQTKEQGGYYLVSEVALWEGSAVTFGANELTPVLEVAKSENKIDFINGINSELNTIVKALSNGKGTDERLYGLEMRHKFLMSQISELALINLPNTKEIITDNKPPIEKGFDWNTVIKSL